MKNNWVFNLGWEKHTSMFSGARASALIALLLFQPIAALATSEYDRKYSLETIGALRSWDNVDGLFADYIASAYKDYFSRQSRFRLVDFSKVNETLSTSKVPYPKAIEDPEILGQLARSMRAESILRTRVQKEGPQYRFTIEWLHSPGMDTLASESFVLSEPGTSNRRDAEVGAPAGETFPGLGDIKGTIQVALKKLFAKVPFSGQLTGRDGESVTINLAGSGGIKAGDTLVVGTIDEVKKHPLLKSLVDWRITPTGKLEVMQVDDNLAFCRIIEEEEGRQIARYQKITQVIPAPSKPVQLIVNEKAEEAGKLDEPPKLGFGAVSLWAGTFGREFSSTGGTVGYSGSSLVAGATAMGQIWFNRNIFADLMFGYGGYSYAQKNLATGESTGSQSVSGGIQHIKFDAGYSYLLNGEFFGPKGWIKLGFHSTSYSLPSSVAESTGPYSSRAIFVGLGGDLPLRDKYGARLDLEFGMFTSGSEIDGISGSLNSASDASIFIGGYYKYKPRITFQVGFNFQSSGAEFATGNTLSNKTFSFAPSVLYYF